jgi:hypothetical protein
MKKMMSDNYAVYLPAVNAGYASIMTKPVPVGRPFPNTLKLDDLMFWKGNNKLFYHPHFLNSVGLYEIGSTPDNAITRRGRTDGTLFGDSGGFQIDFGTIGLKTLQPAMEAEAACLAWREAYELKQWIVGFLETYTNYAMTIDVPLWTPTKPASPFYKCTPEQLTDLTVENLQFIDSHRKGQTKWLNVIQGVDVPNAKKWWDAVKWFKGSGYSISSIIGRQNGVGTLLELLLIMRDEKAFDAGNDWLHLLGISTAPWAIMFTAIQKGLQASANPNLRISYDSASPFLEAGKWDLMTILPDLNGNVDSWIMQKESIPQCRSFLNSPIPLASMLSSAAVSPIAKKLTLGHLNVNDDDGIDTRRQLDTLSSMLITNHNVWTYLETFRQANELAFELKSNRVPSVYKEVIDAIDYVFNAENWASALMQERVLLDNFKG